jgi:hypothetical protein
MPHNWVEEAFKNGPLDMKEDVKFRGIGMMHTIGDYSNEEIEESYYHLIDDFLEGYVERNKWMDARVSLLSILVHVADQIEDVAYTDARDNPDPPERDH